VIRPTGIWRCGFAIAIKKSLPFASRIPPCQGDHLRSGPTHGNPEIGSFENIQCDAIFLERLGGCHADDQSRFLAVIQILPPYSAVRRQQLLERMKSLRVRAEDLEETFSRSGGPGGQHVNKVSSAATLLHRPTGISVTASDSRSQAANRQLALGRLLDLLERDAERSRQAQSAAVSKARRQKARRSRQTKAEIAEGKRRRAQVKRLRRKVEPEA